MDYNHLNQPTYSTLKNYLFYLSLLIVASGCVSKKQYNQLAQTNEALQKDYNQLSGAQRERLIYADSITRLNIRLAGSAQEADEWRTRYLSTESMLKDVNKELASVRYQNEQLQATATASNDALRKELADKIKELDARDKDLRLLVEESKKTKTTIGVLNDDLTEKQLKIKQLSDALNEKDNQMKELRYKIAEILRGFSNGEMTVRQENGKIYVALSENLLFAKGSSTINPKGTEALKKLALTLNASPEVAIEVEGHTDSDGSVESNWTLSTSRAVSVVRVLSNNKIDPKRITASGRAFYVPVAPNDTEANKSKNRRTEIILSPKLDELYNIIKNNK